MTWGIVPAAGIGSRIQPLAFSKELRVESGIHGRHERPPAFVISRDKSGFIESLDASIGPVPLCYVVPPDAAGRCDAILRALPFIAEDEDVVADLSDTISFPVDGRARLPSNPLSF